MGRAIVDGSRVRVVGAPVPRRGQVWAFVADEGTVLVHRCRRVADGMVVLQGDANRAPDRPIPHRRVVGRVVAVDTGAGFVSLGPRDRLVGGAILAYRALRSLLRRIVRRR